MRLSGQYFATILLISSLALAQHSLGGGGGGGGGSSGGGSHGGQRLRAAQSAQQSACAQGGSQPCWDAAAAFQSEENFYRSLQSRYGQCLGGSYALRTNSVPGWAHSFDPLRVELDF